MALTATLGTSPVPLPGGKAGIGFDDLRFSPALGRVLAPAGRAGALDLVDPRTLAVTSVAGFSAQATYGGGHDFGVTSVDEAAGMLFATDRTARQLDVIDPHTRALVGRVKLAASPDYVRAAGHGEIWVTEPDAEQIEVFHLDPGAHPTPRSQRVIRVAGGPESLVIDLARGRAYTHLWEERTVAIDLASHAIVERWQNGCRGSRGIALDEARGQLFVACAEGTAVVLDVAHHGHRLSSWHGQPIGVDVIDYSPRLRHLYLPGARNATMAVLAVSTSGQLSLLGEVPTAPGAHCVTSDDRGRAFVCDPRGGRLLRFEDRFPPAR